MYTCNLCAYNTNRKTDYEKHMNSNKHKKKYLDQDNNSNKKPKCSKLKCNYCDQIFSRSDSLSRHLKYCPMRKYKESNFLDKIKVLEDKLNKSETELVQKNAEIKRFEKLFVHYQNIIMTPVVKGLNKKQKKKIPKKIKNEVWDIYIGENMGSGDCYVCSKTINSKDFEAGHIQSEANGGLTNLDNLRPICSICNKSIGTMNMDEYKKTYYL